MTLTATQIDGLFFANESSGRKTTYWSFSFTNPYTTGGETFQLSTAQTGGTGHFSRKFLGGRRQFLQASVPVALAGLGATATVRGDTSSYQSVVIQLFQGGIGAGGGTWVDNTTANVSGLSMGMAFEGY